MKKKVLIVGAGVAGRDVLREIIGNPDLGLRVVGFIDDDPAKTGALIDGLKVIGEKRDLESDINKLKIKEVIIAIPSAAGEKVAEYVKICSEARVDFRIVPRVKEIIEGKAHVKSLRKVQVEDLLGRPVVKADVEYLKGFFAGKVVLVTGAAGSIGSELSRQIAAYSPKKLILLDWWENGMFELQNELMKDFPKRKMQFVIGNIQDKGKILRVMKTYMPNYIFHAAAYKHVPAMEANPEEAVKNNVFGTLNVAEVANAVNVERFVLISTDKAVKPVSVMGMTKLITEGIAQMLNGKTKFMAVRFGNVLESYGSVIPVFRKQIDAGGPVTITDKRMTRFFMTIPEAVQLVLKASSLGKGGELFVLDMGKPVSIYTLAENLIRLSGYIPGKDIMIAITGKRPGEKISEELFAYGEDLVSTKEGKIFVTKSKGINVRTLPQALGKLKVFAENGDAIGIRSEFKKLSKTFPVD